MIKQTNTNCREQKDILRNKMNQRKLQMRRSIETIDKVEYNYPRTLDLDLLNTA